MSAHGTSSHDAQHERELAELWAAAGGVATSRVEETLARCAGCAQSWARLEMTQARVAEALEAQRRDQQPRSDGRLAPGEANIERMLEKAMRRERPRAKAWPRLLAAAVVLIAVGIGLQRAFAPSPTRPDPELGAALRLLSPLAPADSSASFVFEAADDGGWFEVEVLDAANGSVVLRSARVERSPWTPSAEEVLRIPAAFEWRVTAFDDSGSIEAQARARVAR